MRQEEDLLRLHGGEGDSVEGVEGVLEREEEGGEGGMCLLPAG